MTCMAGAGRQDREKLNMALEGQSDEVGLFFVRFFGAAMYPAAGMGTAGVSCGLHGKGGEKGTYGRGRGCHSSLQGGLLAWGTVCPAHKSKTTQAARRKRR